MPLFKFDISGSRPFVDGNGMELASAEVAWEEAVRLVRDIEGFLEPGENWMLEVSQGDAAIFRIKVISEDIRRA